MSFIPGLRDQACDAYIKRVVALPGEIVSVNNKGEVLIDNKIIPEPYVTLKCSETSFNSCGEFTNFKVPENHFLVLGDNRANSWTEDIGPEVDFYKGNYRKSLFKILAFRKTWFLLKLFQFLVI